MCGKRILLLLTVLAVVAINMATPPRRVAADSGWYAEYFNNQTLSGAPVHTQSYQWIGFYWGHTIPAPGLGSDHFSVRFTRSLWLDRDTAFYFCARADDGVRIWVGDVLVLDEWHGNNGITYCGSQRMLLRGEHQLRVEYYEDGGEALIHVWWEEDAPVSPHIPVIPPTKTAVSLASSAPAPFDAWNGEYFGNRSLAGKPDLGQWDAWIGFDWGVGSPLSEAFGDQFSIRWRRSAWFDAGYYRFCARSDDGVRIWVDDALVVDEWHDSNANTYCSVQWMTAGAHRVHVEYYENLGNALIYVWWRKDLPHRWQ